MVQNSGKTLRTDAIRLNTPEQVRVQEDSIGMPIAVKTKVRQAVMAIEDRWRIDDEWWRTESISRLYYSIVISSGQKMVIYKDLLASRWYRQT